MGVIDPDEVRFDEVKLIIKTIQCPSCKAIVPMSNKFCPICGEKLNGN